MGQAQLVWSEPWDVNRRLKELGTSSEVLRKAVKKAFAAWAACTENHPRNFPGIASWAAGFCGLADDSAPDWQKVEINGQPQLVRGDVAITVASGDENTGRKGVSQPRTRSSKGPVTADAVERNAYLFPQMQKDADEKAAQLIARGLNTWILLMYRDEVAGEVTCELSRPTRMDQEHHIDEWSERIILKPVEFDRADVGETTKGDGGEDGGDISIQIRRRG